MSTALRDKEKSSPSLPVASWPVPFPLLIRICAAFLAVTGGVTLLGWILAPPFSPSLTSNNIPMAPSTALMFMLYAVMLFLRTVTPRRRWTSWTAKAIASAGVAVALLLLILSLQGVYLETEHLGISIMHSARDIPLGHMSPATALCFLFASLSFIFSPSSPASRPRSAAVAGLLAGLLAASGFVFILAYAYGAPLLYGSSYIPPAALTSASFLSLGSALFVLVLPSAWLARLHSETTPRVLYIFMLIFFFLTAGIVTAGFLTYRNHTKNYRTEVERQLAAIAELKAGDLSEYRKERKEDAGFLYDNLSFAALVRRHLEKPGDQANGGQLLEWLGKLQAHYQYSQIRLLDAHGVTRLSMPPDLSPVSSAIAQRLPEVLKAGRVTIQDFYRHDHNGKIYLAVLVPILDRKNGNRPLGLLSLRIDPEQHLYPFLHRWPIPSRSAETLLVRREGQEVVFLNGLRFRKDTALNLRFPLTQTDLPAARAALGLSGIVEGRDYRALPVVADVRPIPDSPWFLVSKISTSEAYAPLREHLWLMGGFIIVLLLGVGALMAFVWQHQRVTFFRERLATAAALKNLNRVYAMLSNINQAILRGRDPQVLFQTACHIAVEDGGFPLAWLGLIDKQSGALVPQASAGKDEGYLDRLRLALGNPMTARGITGEAIRNERYSIVNDIAHDERMASWRDDALARGYRAAAAFPLVVSGAVQGTISLYAKEADFFSAEEITLLDGLAGDISYALEFAEQKRTSLEAEAALRESQQLFATVANTSPALIWMSGLDKGYTWFNEPWLAFTGRAISEEQGNGWVAGIHPEDLARCLQIHAESFEARRPFATEYRLRRHDEEYRWILDQGQPRYDASGAFAGFIGSCLDLTEHRNLENQMRHAMKMESIGTLAGGVAHDFNNILMAIIGYGQLTLMAMSQDDPQRPNIKHILEGADRAARLTKDLLLFSRKQICELKSVDLTRIIKTVEKFIVRVIGEDIVCETRLPDRPLTVLADSHQLEQVLMNFATNARDAMPKGGTFSMTAEQITLNHDFIAAHGFGRSGPYALLTVADSGCGMDEQTRSRIFEPFFTTKEVGKGTGLGLAVVYGIIKQHGGYINVYSEPGRGATFRIYLPLIGAEAVEEINSTRENAPAPGTETILVAEDDASLRILARTTLTHFGYTVIEAADGEEAVRKFKENQAAIHLLLFDIVMPKMNGQEAYEAISKIRPGIKTIFMSGYTPEMIREKVALGEAAPLLAKPLSPTELLRKVRTILDQ